MVGLWAFASSRCVVSMLMMDEFLTLTALY